ncbi:hypothetical protein CKA32_004459 [Geitlerinema sp. FC II]|nr:hypothetical protein CKA32_004459 [Geitlerinema sp. FC II]
MGEERIRLDLWRTVHGSVASLINFNSTFRVNYANDPVSGVFTVDELSRLHLKVFVIERLRADEISGGIVSIDGVVGSRNVYSSDSSLTIAIEGDLHARLARNAVFGKVHLTATFADRLHEIATLTVDDVLDTVSRFQNVLTAEKGIRRVVRFSDRPTVVLVAHFLQVEIANRQLTRRVRVVGNEGWMVDSGVATAKLAIELLGDVRIGGLRRSAHLQIRIDEVGTRLEGKAFPFSVGSRDVDARSFFKGNGGTTEFVKDVVRWQTGPQVRIEHLEPPTVPQSFGGVGEATVVRPGNFDWHAVEGIEPVCIGQFQMS